MSQECGNQKPIKLDEDWCIPFKGPEAKLPRGVDLPPGISLSDLVKGTKKAKSGRIYAVQINEPLYRAIKDSILIYEATSPNGLTREAWIAKYGYDGLAKWIIMQMSGGLKKPVKVGRK